MTRSSTSRIVSVVVLFTLAASLSASAQVKPELVKQGKAATALVIVDQSQYGSAFCVDASGLFVSNAHVVARSTKAGKIRLVLNPGEVNQRVLDGTVLREDPQLDLALIQASAPAGTAVPQYVALPTGSIAKLVETAPIVAYGFPFGRMLSAGPNEFPNCSVSTGRITSLRQSAGSLHRIQVDAALNPGNSGGPLCDGDGKVIGVVTEGVVGAGITLAVPISVLDSFMAVPALALDLPAVHATGRFDPQKFVIRAVGVQDRKSPLAVSLFLRVAAETDREYKLTGKPSEGLSSEFSTLAPPEQSPAGGPKVRVTAYFPSGSISGLVRADLPLNVEPPKTTVRISDVASISNKEGSRGVTTPDMRLTYTRHSGLTTVDFELKPGLVVRQDLSQADLIQVQQLPVRPVGYRIVATRGGKEVASLTGTLEYSARPVTSQPASRPVVPSGVGVAPATPTLTPAAPAGTPATPAVTPTGTTESAVDLTIKPVVLANNQITVRLPASIDDLIVAAGGRLILLPMPKIERLGVFEVSSARLIKALPMAAGQTVVAATATHAFAFNNDQRLVVRYNLHDFTLEDARPFPVPGKVLAAAGASGGNLLLTRMAGDRGSATIVAIDPETLKGVALPNELTFNLAAARDVPLAIRSSADGRLVTIGSEHPPMLGSRGVILSFQRDRLVAYGSRQVESGPAIPASDGGVLYSSSGVFADDLRPLIEFGRARQQCIPAQHGGFFVGIPTNTANGQMSFNVDQASVCSFDSKTPLAKLPPLPELAAYNPMGKSKLTLEKRLLFFPTAELLVTVPEDGGSLLLRTLSLKASSAQAMAGKGVLLVQSIPPMRAERGSRYTYQMSVITDRPKVRYRLLSGPTGMTLTPTGLINWFPGGTTGGEAVKVAIETDQGDRVEQTWFVRIEAPHR